MRTTQDSEASAPPREDGKPVEVVAEHAELEAVALHALYPRQLLFDRLLDFLGHRPRRQPIAPLLHHRLHIVLQTRCNR